MSLVARRSHVVLTIAGCFSGGSLYGWSGFMPAVRAQFDLNNAAASMVFSIALVSFTFGVLLGPTLMARISLRLCLPMIASFIVLALVAAGTSAGFTAFTLAYGVCFGFATGVLYNFAVSLAAASGSPTLLVPVCVAAFGLGGAVFGPVQFWLSEAGWGLWSIMPALVCFAVVAFGGLAFKFPGQAQDMPQNRASARVRFDKTLATLWVIFAAGSCAGLIVLGFAAQFLSRAPDGVGLASLAIFLAASGNTLGRLSSALTAGRFGPACCIAGALTMSIITLACLAFTSAPGILIGLLFLIAFAYGQLAATMPLLVKSCVSEHIFPKAFGWVFTGWGVAGLVGPWTAGWLLDATGTLKGALFICIALSLLSLWLVLSLARKGRAEQQC